MNMSPTPSDTAATRRSIALNNPATSASLPAVSCHSLEEVDRILDGLRSFSKQQSVVENRINFPVEIWWYDLGQKTYGLLKRLVQFWYR